MFGVRAEGGQLVATAALLPYSAGNAWISMVLVTESWRRRGLATKLVDTCLNAATRQGLTCWLDATPAGADVYGPLGFTPTLQLRRLRLENSTRPATDAPALLPVGDLAATDRARSQRDGIRSQYAAGGVCRTSRFAAAVERRRGGAGPRRPHRGAYRSAIRG